MPSKLLTVREIDTLPAKARRYADGDGLYIRVAVSGSGDKQRVTKSWVFKYRSPVTGIARYTGLGPYPRVSLAKARIEAEKVRRKVRKGKDPVDQNAKKGQKRVKEAKSLTFGQCAEKYIESQKHGWTNPAHIAQWHSTFNETKRGKLVFPALTADLNGLPVRKVDTEAVVECLEKIWTTKTETAKRVRGRIEAVLDWAKVRGYRSGDNPARWSGHLDKILAKPSKVKSVEHHPAMPWREVPAFMAKLRSGLWVSHRALEFMVLTATRTSAVIHAQWDEIDFAERLWTVQPGRVGAKITDGKPRTVPLSDRVIEILRAVPRIEGNPHVFVGSKGGRGLSDMAMLEVMRDIAPAYVPHGFRSTFSDWCTDQTSFPARVREASLWHVVQNKVEAAYNRTDVIEPRRLLMADWANFCSRPPVDSDSVVTPMRRTKETA